MALQLEYHEGPDGLLYPNLTLKEQEDYTLGKYGLMRKRFLQEQKRSRYQALLLKDELWEHLVDIDKRALQMEDQIVVQMAQQNGVNEQMKTEHQMEWVQKMNNFIESAQEIVMNDLIFQ